MLDKPRDRQRRMVDLFAGKLGWAKAFLTRGWKVVAVDLVEPDEVPEGVEFLVGDVMRFHYDSAGLYWQASGEVERLGEFDFICASSPCEEFSTLRNFQQPTPYPEKGIQLFNHTRAICEASGVPYVLENVAGAMRFVGKPVNRCGPYYLWGSGVPTIMPQGISKGLTELAMGLREHKGKPGWDNRHGKLGQTPSELVATIPPELANCVADYAERILELEEVGDAKP